MTSPDLPPVPTGTALLPAADLRTRLGRRVLVGGVPLGITRLSSAGATLVRRWFQGEPVGSGLAERTLARRLCSSGMAHPRPPAADPQPITVVVPVKDDRAGLTVTLDRLLGVDGAGPAGPVVTGPVAIVVIDDGSATAVTIDRPSVTVHRRETAGGPGVARQDGLALVATPLVAFVDAGVLIDPSAIATLARALDDPAAVAVAPRVRSAPGDHVVARFDERRSPLDLGPTESAVGPGRAVPYVPTACLLARAEAVAAVGGFDPGLRYGEDVDLVWRLAELGQVRYLPEVVAVHRPRPTLAAMIDQRRSYGSAAAPLAARHGAAVAPTRVSPWTLVVLALLLAGRPGSAMAVATGTGLALRPKIQPLPDLTVEALLLTGRGHWYGALSVLAAALRTWAPIGLVTAALVPRLRRPLGALAVAAAARRLLDGPRRPRDAALDLTLGVVDDLAYCAGVWQGVVSCRSPAALLPALSSWPGRGDRPLPEAVRQRLAVRRSVTRR